MLVVVHFLSTRLFSSRKFRSNLQRLVITATPDPSSCKLLPIRLIITAKTIGTVADYHHFCSIVALCTVGQSYFINQWLTDKLSSSVASGNINYVVCVWMYSYVFWWTCGLYNNKIYFKMKLIQDQARPSVKKRMLYYQILIVCSVDRRRRHCPLSLTLLQQRQLPATDAQPEAHTAGLSMIY